MALASLTVDLNLKLAKFESELSRATQIAARNAQNMERAFGAVSSAVAGLAGVLGVGALGVFAKNAIDSAAALDDMAEATGASVEGLSKLTDVARIGGKDIAVVETALLKLQKTLSGTDEETKGAADAFRNLGLSVEELRRLSPEQQFDRLARALNSFADDQGKASNGLAIFGRQWREIAPLIKDYGENMDRAASVTAEQAAEAEKLQKSIAAMQVNFQNTARTLVGEAVPALNSIAEAMRQAAKEGGLLAAAWAGLGGLGAAIFTDEFAGQAEKLNNSINRTQVEIGTIQRQLDQVRGGGLLNKLLFGSEADLAAKLQAAQGQLAALKAQLEGLGLKTGTAAETRPSLPSIAPPNEGAAREAKRRVDEAERDRQRLLAEGTRGWVQAIDEQIAAYERELVEIAKVNDALAEQARLADEARNRAFITQAEQINGTDPESERLRREMERAYEEFDRLKEQTESTTDVARELGLTFSSAFEDAVISGKKFSEVLKGIGQDILKIFLRKTVTEPLAGFAADFFKGGLSSIFGGPTIPKLASGTDYVPRDGLAYLHKGEAVIPASANIGGGRSVNIVMNVDSRSDRASILQAMMLAKEQAKAEILDSMRRGGSFA